jgi:carboxylesterase type B
LFARFATIISGCGNWGRRRGMMDAWVRFAANSDPNGGNLPYWPPYRIASDPYLELGDHIVARAGYRTEDLDFVQAFFDSKEAK